MASTSITWICHTVFNQRCLNPNQSKIKIKNRTKPILFWIFLDDFFLKPIGSVQFAIYIFETDPNQTNYNTCTNTYITLVLCILCVCHLNFIILCSVMYTKLVQYILLSFSNDFFKICLVV